MHNDILIDIAKYAVYFLGCIMVWFFNELRNKVAKSDLEAHLSEMKKQIKDLQEENKENTKFIYTNLATKEEIKNIEQKLDSMHTEITTLLLNEARKRNKK